MQWYSNSKLMGKSLQDRALCEIIYLRQHVISTVFYVSNRAKGACQNVLRHQNAFTVIKENHFIILHERTDRARCIRPDLNI